MSATLDRVRACAAVGDVVATVHAAGRIDLYGLVFDDLVESLLAAAVVEDYPDANRGPSVLALHRLPDADLVHAVWAIARDRATVAVLVTAYRPDPTRWSADLLTRRPR